MKKPLVRETLKMATATCPELLDEIYAKAEQESNALGREVHVAELLQSYLIHRPQHARAWAIYGNALRELGRQQDSLEALQRAFDAAPDDYKGYVAVELGMLLKDFHSPTEAKKWFEIATDSIGETNGWVWILAGANLFALGEHHRAIECFEVVVAADDDERDEALLNLGIVYRALRQYEKATDCFKRALELDPGYQEARAALKGLSKLHETTAMLDSLKRQCAH